MRGTGGREVGRDTDRDLGRDVDKSSHPGSREYKPGFLSGESGGSAPEQL